MVKITSVIPIFLVHVLHVIRADDPYERQVRNKCFGMVKDTNCPEPFVEKYPQLSRSYSNLTLADTYFYLFATNNSREAEYLHLCGGSLSEKSRFNPHHRTVIITPGFTQSPCLQTWPRDLLNQYLIHGSYNVILIDWTWGNAYSLSDATENMKIVAKQLAIVIRNIKTAKGVKADNFHLIGMSLGVQLAGLTGREEPVRRITGLDPAGPFYSYVPQSDMLRKGDAKLVDVIHTGGGNCFPFFGTLEQEGVSDFYVNGGSFQPGCFKAAMEYLSRYDLETGIQFFIPVVCWHLMSIRYFATTINADGCELWGTSCNSYQEYHPQGPCRKCHKKGPDCEIMGQDWELTHDSNSAVGRKYYLNITAPCPYCVKHRQFPWHSG